MNSLENQMDEVTEVVQELLEEMTDEQRIVFIDNLSAGFCRHCGSVKTGVCYCLNDE